MKKINKKGQGLIEALVALGAATLIISAIAIAVINSVNNSDFSKNQNLATQYAQQGIEILRQKSKSDWNDFSSYTGTFCLAQNSTALVRLTGPSCGANVNNFFLRQVVITQGDVSCGSNAKVFVSVAWTDGKCTNTSNVYCHVVSLDSCFANINAVPTP